MSDLPPATIQLLGRLHHFDASHTLPLSFLVAALGPNLPHHHHLPGLSFHHVKQAQDVTQLCSLVPCAQHPPQYIPPAALHTWPSWEESALGSLQRHLVIHDHRSIVISCTSEIGIPHVLKNGVQLPWKSLYWASFECEGIARVPYIF